MNTCKRLRLCTAVDVALLTRYPGRKLDEYRDMARQLELGTFAAGRLAQGPFPESGTELLTFALKLHGTIFSQGDPRIAGRLRSADVHFGTGANQMRGVRADDIADRFAAFNLGLPPTEDRHALARWGARLLHTFFTIHPFDDGNGRVARRLLEWGVESSGRWALAGHTRGSSRESRQYVQALEYAHRHAPTSDNPKAQRFFNHLRYLTLWLEARIVEQDLDEASEPPAAH